MVWLEWSIDWDSKVVGLVFGQLGKLNSELFKMEGGDFFVKGLGENVESKLVLLFCSELGPEFDLSQNLVGEGVGHDERRMSSGTSKVDQSSFGEENDVTTVLQEISVNLNTLVNYDFQMK